MLVQRPVFTHVRLRPALPKRFPDADPWLAFSNTMSSWPTSFCKSRVIGSFGIQRVIVQLDLADTLPPTLRQVPAFREPYRVNLLHFRADRVPRPVPHATRGLCSPSSSMSPSTAMWRPAAVKFAKIMDDGFHRGRVGVVHIAQNLLADIADQPLCAVSRHLKMRQCLLHGFGFDMEFAGLLAGLPTH